MIIYELITLEYPFKIDNECFFKMAESILYDEIPSLKPNTPEHFKQLIRMYVFKLKLISFKKLLFLKKFLKKDTPKKPK